MIFFKLRVNVFKKINCQKIMKKVYIQYIQELSVAFAKYHYNKHLEKHNLTYIEYDNVKGVVTEVYTKDMQKQLFSFIRHSLKEDLKDSYNPMMVEPLLQEIADNPETAIERICIDIHDHQKKFYKVNDR